MKNALTKDAAVKMNLKNNPKRHFILRECMALALLPADQIRPTFERIREEAEKKFGNVFEEFFNYVDSYWMKR